MRFVGPGHALFAFGLAGLGALSLGSGDFAYSWQPVPVGFPWREVLARMSGAVLLAGGLGMVLARTAKLSALSITVYLLSCSVLLHGPPVVHAPRDVGAWLGLAENVVLFCGGWILFACLRRRGGGAGAGRLSGRGALVTARILVGVSCLVLGLSHFVYTEVTAGMIPRWFPARLGLAYFTGTAHAAAGLGILLSILPRMAATLEAAMVSLFVLLLHLPGVIGEPGSRLQWTMLFVASALAGAFWLTAGTFREAPVSAGG